MDVVLLLKRELIVNDETDLLDIDTSGEQVSGDKHADGTRSELLHDDLSLLLVHLSVHRSDDEVLLCHSFLKGVDATLSVAVDDGLLNIEVGVKIEQHLDLPLSLLHGDVVLADTVKGEGLLLDKDLGWRPHEVLGKAKNIGR